MHTIVKNRPANHTPVTPPPHPGGGEWEWCATFNGGWDLVFADTPTDIIDAIAPGYLHHIDTGDGVAAADVRISLALTAANSQQAFALTDELPDNTRPLTAREYNAALSHKLNPPQPAVEHWEHPTVPLIVLDIAFEPWHPTSPPPVGNIITLTPGADDETFLRSLHDCGYITLARRTRT